MEEQTILLFADDSNLTSTTYLCKLICIGLRICELQIEEQNVTHHHENSNVSVIQTNWYRELSRECHGAIAFMRNDWSSVAWRHYIDVIMTTVASQITSLTIVYSIVYSGADQRKHQSPASLAFVRGIHPGPVNSPHKWPVTRKMFPFDDVIMKWRMIIPGED